jgi:hypothetical protein
MNHSDLNQTAHDKNAIFFHPDFTVGLGISPNLLHFHAARGLYRR